MAIYIMNNNLISVEELVASLNDNNLAILDGSWYLPNQNRNAFEEFKCEHILGAQFFDIDAISDPTTNLPHMVPTAALFSESVENLGTLIADIAHLRQV